MLRRKAVLGIMILAATAACSAQADEEDGAASSDSALVSDTCPERAAHPSWIQTRTLDMNGARLRVGSMGSGARGDVLYLHGFADRFDNHRPLFERFVAAGLRVITFDYPSHGESCKRSIGSFGFTGLAQLAGRVVAELDGGSSKPLYVAGWSTGGLLAVRLAQGLGESSLPRPIAAMALFTPGVDVRTFSPATNPASGVTDATLTRNPSPPHVGPPKPSWIGAVPAFATELLANEQLSRAPLPAGLPVLVMTGGEETDRYAVTGGITAWAERQSRSGALVSALGCAGGFHEIDNEPEPMGSAVRDAAASFLASGGTDAVASGGGCAPLLAP